ncbi:MAG: HAD family hydrolase [Hungatella sp.]|nr:HAD family hydrolase [Hungatella sp.]
MEGRMPREFRCRILYSDIDGTLLNSSHHVSRGTRERILELDRRGILFILVSARMPQGVRVIQRELGTDRPIICYSGGLILDEKGQALYSRRIKLGAAVEIRDVLKERFPGICCNAYGGDLWVVEDDGDPRVVREERIVKGKALRGDMREVFAGDGGIHKFLLMGELGEIRQAEVFLRDSYPGLTVLRSNAYYLEVMDGTVDKAAGVRFLCGHYGIPVEEAAAFGDGENDVGMLKAVKYGFAMGNASKSVREQAAFVTLSNDDEGILEVIREL